MLGSCRNRERCGTRFAARHLWTAEQLEHSITSARQNAYVTSPDALPEQGAPRPDAVVFDTNVWSSGRFNADTFKARATRLGKAGIKVLVPEVILWEWASHSAQDAKNGVDSWRRLAKAGLVFGSYPGPHNHVDVLARLREFLAAIPNVQIIPVSGESAIDGLRDQVLQTGPGSTKQGVKTGAADSAWVRDVLHAVGGDPAKVIFVSGDVKGVRSTCQDLGITSPRIVSEHELFTALFAFDPAPDPVTRLVADHLLTTFDSALAADDGHTPPMDAWIAVSEFDIHAPTGLEDLYSGDSVTLDPEPTLIGVREVEVLDFDEGKPNEATVRFEVVLLGHLTVWGYDLDADGTVESTTTTVWNQLIEAPMIAEVQDLSLRLLASDGPATVSDPEQRFPDGQEARQWLADALTAFQGVTVHELTAEGSPGTVSDDPGLLFIEADELALRSPLGRTVTVTFSGSVYDDWTAEFEADELSVEIVCRYDPGVRVWAGRDSFDSADPFFLASEDSDISPEPFTSLAAVWRSLFTQE